MKFLLSFDTLARFTPPLLYGRYPPLPSGTF